MLLTKHWCAYVHIDLKGKKSLKKMKICLVESRLWKAGMNLCFGPDQNFGGLENMSSFRKCNHTSQNIVPTEPKSKTLLFPLRSNDIEKGNENVTKEECHFDTEKAF
jgi:hypothetical protein